MKSIVTKMLAVLMVGALTSVVALAKVQKEKVTFDNDIKVNGTLVKKGTYDVKFDDETGQLSIIKNGKVVAEAMTRLEPRSKKANDFQVRSVTNGDETSTGRRHLRWIRQRRVISQQRRINIRQQLRFRVLPVPPLRLEASAVSRRSCVFATKHTK